MQIEVHNPNNLPLIDYRVAKPLQGKLKDLNQENYKKLKGRLEERGFKVPLFLWKQGEDFYLMDGHQRQRVMIKEDARPYEVPYILIEAENSKDAKAQLLEITSQYGTITQEGLDEFMAEAELPEAETMEAVNFDRLSLFGATQPNTNTQEDTPPSVNTSDPAISQPGEIYQLGRHRVMCGSAVDEDDTNKLLGDQQIDLYITDPPYNVDYTGKTKDALKIQNDKKDDGEFLAFLADSHRRADEHMKAGAAFYIFHADSEGFNFRAAVKEAGWMLKQCLIWVKQTMVMGRQDYHWQHEPILYGWKSGASHSWYSDRKQTTVLNFDRPSRNGEHPTMKPISIIAYLIQNSSKEGDLIFDNFLGSGSTLIACEQINRTCFGMELDPRYVDVIRKRYANLIERDDWEEATPAL